MTSREIYRGVIKGNDKKYKRKKDGKEIVKQSLYVNLGVNSLFNKDDMVVILTEDYYDSIVNDNTSDNIINQLNNKITEQDNTLHNKEQEITELSNKFDELNKEIATLNNLLSDKEQNIRDLELELNRLNSYNIDDLLNKSKELESLKYYYMGLQSEKIEFKDVINYLNNRIDKLENRNVILRLINKDNTTDIVKPTLNLIDLQGNSLNKSDANSTDIIINNSNKSE